MQLADSGMSLVCLWYVSGMSVLSVCLSTLCKMLGVDPGAERWEAVEEGCKGLVNARGWAFLDVHMMLAFSHGRPTECAARAAVAEQIVKVWGVSGGVRVCGVSVVRVWGVSGGVRCEWWSEGVV